MRHDNTLSTDDLMRAYVKSGLRRIGVSYQTAVMTPCIAIALRNTTAAMRKQSNSSNSAPQPQVGVNSGSKARISSLGTSMRGFAEMPVR